MSPNNFGVQPPPVERIVRQLQTVARTWPTVIAESIGMRECEPPKPAAGAVPHRHRWAAETFGACWLGQATVLLRMGGLTLLTDPHLEERAGFDIAGHRVGRLRSTALPAGAHDLPDLNVVLLSHAHLDHWDRSTLLRIAHPRTTVVIPTGTRRLLPSGFGEVIELPWGHEAWTRDMRITAIRPRHLGARFFFDTHRGYNAYLVEAAGRRVLFAGDTAHTGAFDHLASGPRAGVDLAILGIGSYHPWEDRHATPEQAADMARRMGARLILPVHHSTFRDPGEPIDEPLQRLMAACDPSKIICPRVGDSWFEPAAA